MKVPFSKPFNTGRELEYIQDIISHRRDSSGDGKYTKKVHKFLQKRYRVPKVLLTTSCTTALEFAVRLCDLKFGDEVIVPSFTFSSTVNAVLMQQGLKVVFADIDPVYLTIDPKDIKKKITKKTRAIIVVHYAGVACDMDEIMALAKKYKLLVIEDAAQAIDAKYKGKYLGTIGDFGCISFHDTKNITCGEGGALFINKRSKKLVEKAEIIREKGTNRSKFFRGLVDKYTWVDVGSSYLPSDILAAYLLAQLEHIDEIQEDRANTYSFYAQELGIEENLGIYSIPQIPPFAHHNAHIFYLMFKRASDRDFVLNYAQKKGVSATFHYIPLHSAPQGRKLGYIRDDFPQTEAVSSRLLRLPLYSGMSLKEREYVVKVIKMAVDELAAERNYTHTASIFHGIPKLSDMRFPFSLIGGFLVSILG